MNDIIIVSIIAGFVNLLAILSAFWIGSRKFPLEARKFQAEEKFIQAQTIESQGKSLSDAFDEIQELRVALEEERRARLELERQLKQWRNYAAKLQRQIIEDFKGIPTPFETTPPAKSKT